MRRGFTLVEVLVASTLALLVMGMAFMLLVPAMHAFARGSAQSQTQSDLLIALSRLDADLESGSPEGIAFVSSGTQSVLAIQPMDRPAPDGTPQWQAQMIVFTWLQSRQALYRQVWTNLPNGLPLQPTSPTKLTSEQLSLLPPGPTAVKLAEGVTAFTIDAGLPSDRGLSGPLILGLTVQRSPGQSLSLTRSVGMRNP
ncbi:MAG: PilW family protein [Candidatus Xenobia bacterium]